jgi:hypothetical protein
MNLSHLLILGAPRSGTTLLATMVSQHTEIGILNEDRGCWYRENGMNIDKVNRAQKESIDFKLAERVPATYRKYQELTKMCGTKSHNLPQR